MRFKTSDGVRLEYDDSGQGPVVMILSGIGGSRVIWRDQVSALVDAGYRVINIDARNQGASEHTKKGLRISRHAMDLREICEALDIHQPILIGNSMGASTMFAYASLFGTQDVAAIVDVDQSPKMINEPGWKYGFKGEVTWDNFPDILKKPFGKSTYHKLRDETYAVNKKSQVEHPYDPALNLPFLQDHASQDWRDVIAEFTCPFLILAGEKSPFFDYHYAPEVASLAAKGEYQIIKDSGHIVMAEQPVAFNQALFKFLKENDL